MTLRAQISADVDDVFLNTSDYAEEITHWPGDGAQPETITVIMDYDVLDPAVGRSGMSSVITDEHGVNVKNRVAIEMSASVVVTSEEQGGQNPSRFEVFERDADGAKTGGSSIWIAKRAMGKDHGMQLVEAWLVEQKATRRQ